MGPGIDPAAAKRRLADEYDAAQERGEVGQRTGRPKDVPDQNDIPPPTAADIGLTRKDIHEARQIRDAEVAEPGIVKKTLTELGVVAPLDRALPPPEKSADIRTAEPIEGRQMREFFAFLFAAYGYAFVYVLAFVPTRVLIDALGDDDNKYVNALKAAALFLIPALISWIMNDFVLGSNGMLDDPNGARGVGPIEW